MIRKLKYSGFNIYSSNVSAITLF